MIVSASYRTDIPAFYGDWFAARLAQGICRVANPYGGADYLVRLDRADGFVFWTKNATPFLPVLAGLARAGRPFVVQHTITAYPRALEASAPPAGAGLAAMAEIRRLAGPHAAVWRYDPIVLSSLSESADHLDRFARLARALEGVTDEVVVSFVHPYRKSARNLDRAAARHGFAWRDASAEEKAALARRLAAIAADRGIRLTVCSQPEITAPAASPAACIDADRLSRAADRPITARRRGNRPGCLCAESRDIGAYDSCPMGCAYCYAVGRRATAQARLRSHDVAADMLAVRPQRA